MARILGIDLPNERKIIYALTEIYGIGLSLSEKIVSETKISEEKRVKDLTEGDIAKLQKGIEKYPVEGELRRLVGQNIRRLEEISSYRGLRHKKGLPVRGQRTRSNARTKRGNRQTVGAIKKEMKAQVAVKAQGEGK